MRNQAEQIRRGKGLKEFVMPFQPLIIMFDNRLRQGILNWNQVLAKRGGKTFNPLTLDLLGVLFLLTSLGTIDLLKLFQTIVKRLINFTNLIEFFFNFSIAGNIRIVNPLASLELGGIFGIDPTAFCPEAGTEDIQLGRQLGNNRAQFSLGKLADFRAGQVVDVFHSGRSVIPNGSAVNNKNKEFLGGQKKLKIVLAKRAGI
ncbi:MAG: hypothetical protein EBZ87_03315 [Microbacteriaceae bacterium]|nr:hypothetical protein [Microbacteriaceae bacterium]